MMSEFVGRSKLMRTSPSNSRFSRPWPPPAGRARDGDARDGAQRRRQLVAVGVLAVIDVDAPVAALDGDVELLDEHEHARVRAIGGDDDELVRALVGDDLRDAELGAEIAGLGLR